MSNQDKFAGKAKEVTGKATGDRELEDEGERQHAKGKFKEKVDDAKDTAKGAVESAKDSLSSDDER
ncbi:MAG: CsbD family protein [Nitriliruptoraceae bacterium]|nr:CsbD family protein [Nitriliruptoraceae bacterium]